MSCLVELSMKKSFKSLWPGHHTHTHRHVRKLHFLSFNIYIIGFYMTTCICIKIRYIIFYIPSQKILVILETCTQVLIMTHSEDTDEMWHNVPFHQALHHRGPGRVAQLVTCMATDACLTAYQGVASSIPVCSHTFVEIDLK